MKTALIAAIMVATAAATASAAEFRAPVPASSLYTCAGRSLSKVAAIANPAPCCSGMLGCPQLLANTGLIRPKPDNRT